MVSGKVGEKGKEKEKESNPFGSENNKGDRFGRAPGNGQFS